MKASGWQKTGKDTWRMVLDGKTLFVTRWVSRWSSRAYTSWVVIGRKPRDTTSITYATPTVLVDGVYHTLESTTGVKDAKLAAERFARTGEGTVTGSRARECNHETHAEA